MRMNPDLDEIATVTLQEDSGDISLAYKNAAGEHVSMPWLHLQGYWIFGQSTAKDVYLKNNGSQPLALSLNDFELLKSKYAKSPIAGLLEQIDIVVHGKSDVIPNLSKQRK